jgi:hypothetical protein
MNAFESFEPKKPIHDPIGEPAPIESESDFELEWSRQNALVEEAKTRYEGVLLYAPIPSELKEKIIAKLESTSMNPSHQAHIFKEAHQGPFDAEHDELRASLWLQREMKGFVESLKDQMTETDYYMLPIALENLTIPENNRTRTIVNEDGKWNLNWK